MNIAPVAYRYAQSLISLAKEQDSVESIQEDMHLVATTTTENHELVVLLKSPVVKADKKVLILNKIFAGKVGEVTSRFMGILVRKGREALLPEIAAAYNELYKQNKNIITAEVSSAIELSAEALEKVRAQAIEKHPGKTIELVQRIDPSLIGGVVIRIGDEQYDGSVSRRLSDLRRDFSKNPYIPAI
ncbi:MAG TPA: ATP synthase F1 subunit delta [Flavobacteriales bacterium]|nr:ATP synthase F1 subunit delta [Flavobacteriales bacterium]HQV76152.1 ATP synthase F1 subunit delta [Flavobacteriales bacterium]